MYETTIHYVEGVGKQVTYPTDTQFNPKIFEQAIHGLQQITLDFARHKNRSTDAPDEPYAANHTRTTDDSNTPILELEEDSALDNIVNTLIRGWDRSVLIDTVWDHSYAIQTSVNCGGGHFVYATVYLREGDLSKFTVGHTDLTDPSERIETTDLSPYDGSRTITHLIRSLERAVTEAYATTINSAATAFDFLATKTDIPPTGGSPSRVKNHRETYYQKDWAEIRGKTEQTVSNNASSARRDLFELPDHAPFETTGPALTQLSEDADDADIRLV